MGGPLHLQASYRWGGSCWYTGGFKAAGLAEAAGVIPCVPGSLATVGLVEVDAVLDGPVPLRLVSRFRDVPPGMLGPDAPAPGGDGLPRAVIDNLKGESVTMATDYDRIAGQYKRAKLQPWREHIERYTLLRLVGDVAGRAAIDLACGEGYYTRELRRRARGSSGWTCRAR